MTKLIILFFALAALAGCDNGGQAIEAERTNDRQLREVAEQRAVRQEEIKNFWQGSAVFLGIGGVVLLVVGASLGSRARSDARKKRRYLP